MSWRAHDRKHCRPVHCHPFSVSVIPRPDAGSHTKPGAFLLIAFVEGGTFAAACSPKFVTGAFFGKVVPARCATVTPIKKVALSRRVTVTPIKKMVPARRVTVTPIKKVVPAPQVSALLSGKVFLSRIFAVACHLSWRMPRNAIPYIIPKKRSGQLSHPLPMQQV